MPDLGKYDFKRVGPTTPTGLFSLTQSIKSFDECELLQSQVGSYQHTRQKSCGRESIQVLVRGRKKRNFHFHPSPETRHAIFEYQT